MIYKAGDTLYLIKIKTTADFPERKEYGENSPFEYGKNMSENYKFCKDVGMDFIGCGVLNLIDNSIDSDGNGVSDYDEMVQ
jgi:hypothetical protein